MKKAKYILITLLVLIISGWIFFAWVNKLHTPAKQAERISGLELPKDLKIISYKDEWKSFNGDGETEIKIKLTIGEINKLSADCIRLGYKKLPISENGYSPTFLSIRDSGYYKLSSVDERDPSTYSISILNISGGYLYVFMIIT